MHLWNTLYTFVAKRNVNMRLNAKSRQGGGGDDDYDHDNNVNNKKLPVVVVIGGGGVGGAKIYKHAINNENVRIEA